MANKASTLENVVDNVKESSGNAVQSFEKKVSDIYQKGQEVLSDTVDKIGPVLKSTYEQAGKQVSAAVDETEATIKKYPVQTLLVGFGVGFLLGAAIQSFRKAA